MCAFRRFAGFNFRASTRISGEGVQDRAGYLVVRSTREQNRYQGVVRPFHHARQEGDNRVFLRSTMVTFEPLCFRLAGHQTSLPSPGNRTLQINILGHYRSTRCHSNADQGAGLIPLGMLSGAAVERPASCVLHERVARGETLTSFFGHLPRSRSRPMLPMP